MSLNCLIEVRNYGDACLCDALNMNVWNASVTALIHLGQVGVRNKQNLYPRIPTTDVAKLLQYSGSRVEHRDGFSS